MLSHLTLKGLRSCDPAPAQKETKVTAQANGLLQPNIQVQSYVEDPASIMHSSCTRGPYAMAAHGCARPLGSRLYEAEVLTRVAVYLRCMADAQQTGTARQRSDGAVHCRAGQLTHLIWNPPLRGLTVERCLCHGLLPEAVEVREPRCDHSSQNVVLSCR